MTAPTKSQRERWSRLRDLGCVLCESPAAIHHCHTGGGGRKDHDQVLPLCWSCHQGPNGLHTVSRRVWEAKHGTEAELMEKVREQLGEFS